MFLIKEAARVITTRDNGDENLQNHSWILGELSWLRLTINWKLSSQEEHFKAVERLIKKHPDQFYQLLFSGKLKTKDYQLLFGENSIFLRVKSKNDPEGKLLLKQIYKNRAKLPKNAQMMLENLFAEEYFNS